MGPGEDTISRSAGNTRLKYPQTRAPSFWRIKARKTGADKAHHSASSSDIQTPTRRRDTLVPLLQLLYLQFDFVNINCTWMERTWPATAVRINSIARPDEVHMTTIYHVYRVPMLNNTVTVLLLCEGIRLRTVVLLVGTHTTEALVSITSERARYLLLCWRVGGSYGHPVHRDRTEYLFDNHLLPDE